MDVLISGSFCCRSPHSVDSAIIIDRHNPARNVTRRPTKSYIIHDPLYLTFHVPRKHRNLPHFMPAFPIDCIQSKDYFQTCLYPAWDFTHSAFPVSIPISLPTLTTTFTLLIGLHAPLTTNLYTIVLGYLSPFALLRRIYSASGSHLYTFCLSRILGPGWEESYSKSVLFTTRATTSSNIRDLGNEKRASKFTKEIRSEQKQGRGNGIYAYTAQTIKM